MTEKTFALFSSGIRAFVIAILTKCFGRWEICHACKNSTNATDISSRWRINCLLVTEVCRSPQISEDINHLHTERWARSALLPQTELIDSIPPLHPPLPNAETVGSPRGKTRLQSRVGRVGCSVVLRAWSCG